MTINAKWFTFLKMFEKEPEKFYVEETDFKKLGDAIHNSEIRKEETRKKTMGAEVDNLSKNKSGDNQERK